MVFKFKRFFYLLEYFQSHSIKWLFKIYLNIKFTTLDSNFLKFTPISLSILHTIFTNFQ